MKTANKDIIPLVIGILLMLISLIIILTSNHVLKLTHYIGLAALIIVTVLYLTSRKFYLIGLGLVLILGLFGLLNFFYVDFKIGFGEFGINPLFVVLILLYFLFCKDSMNTFFPDSPKDKKE